MHQSGTHWLKFMLANAMAYQFGTPPPEFNHANDIIGGPRDAQVYPQLPRLVSSHTVPHYIATLAAVHRHFRLPPYVLLLRDMRVALVSNYHKWRDRYGIPFAEFLSGDPSGAVFNSDIWWAIRFLNGWGDVYANAAPRIVVVKYEDLVVDAAAELRRVAAHFNLALSPAAIAAGVDASSKSAMHDKHDPARPPGAVRDDCARPVRKLQRGRSRIVRAPKRALSASPFWLRLFDVVTRLKGPRGAGRARACRPACGRR